MKGPYLCRCVCLVNGLTIEPESDLPHRQSLRTERDGKETNKNKKKKDQFSI